MAVKKKTVLLQGAFDILHAAHIRAFKFAKAQGDYLIVALNTDQLISRYKSKKCIVPWSQRKIMIEACRYVDKVVPATEFSPLKLLKQHKIDVYVLSREWKHTKDVEFAYMKSVGGKVCFSARSRTVSSSAIKARLLKEYLNGAHSTANGPAGQSDRSGLSGQVVRIRPMPAAESSPALGLVWKR
jgi:glycerol-3-phosphate cytidylyltransferase